MQRLILAKYFNPFCFWGNLLKSLVLSLKKDRKIDFSQEIQIVLLICSIKIGNFWETVLMIPVYRYSFLV